MGNEPLSRQQTPAALRRVRVILLLLMLYAGLIALYWWIRYRGLWIETDTSFFVRAIDAMVNEGTIQPLRYVYIAGYNYQAIATALVQLGGITPSQLVILLLPFFVVLSVPLLFLLYRELLGNPDGKYTAALLATSLLLFQPEILFSLTRGNHEKVTLPLIMLATYFLANSLQLEIDWRRFLLYAGLFIMATLAVLSSNIIFASAYLATVGLSLLGNLFLLRWRAHSMRWTAALRFVCLAGSIVILAFLFTSFWYTPVLVHVSLISRAWSRVLSLVAGLRTGSSPYTYISTYWVNPELYPVITLFNWVILLIASVEWFSRFLWALRTLRNPKGSQSALLFNLLDVTWFFYLGYGLQFASALVFDRVDLGIGANLEIRIFPLVMLFAVPLAVIRLLKWRAVLATRPSRAVRAITQTGVTIFIIWFAVAGIAKAANEPLLVSKFPMYTIPEQAAISWTDHYVRKSDIWIGADERLRELFNSQLLTASRANNTYNYGDVPTSARYFLLSDLVREQNSRMRKALPDVDSKLLLYDNGSVQIYHAIPVTPYQR